MNQAGVAEVVQPSRAENLGSGLEPHGLAQLDAVLRSSGVTQPRAPSMAQRAWMTSSSRLRAKVSGSEESPAVSAVVASELTGQVRRGVRGEGAQPLGSVGAIPARDRTN